MFCYGRRLAERLNIFLFKSPLNKTKKKLILWIVSDIGASKFKRLNQKMDNIKGQRTVQLKISFLDSEAESSGYKFDDNDNGLATS